MEKKIEKARLKKLGDVRRYLARLINETRSGVVEPGLASKIGYLCNILIGCIKDRDLEVLAERLDAFEKEYKLTH